MRLTALTDYAMRLLMYVGQHPDRLCTISEVAQRYGISEAHLMKVTHRLGQGGWIETVRGNGGDILLCDLQEGVFAIFDTLGFTQLYKVFPDEAAALADLAGKA